MVTIAVPVLNGARWLPSLLRALASQEVDMDVELLVCDSGSTDGSRSFAGRAGARILDVAPGTFRHSSTRNLLMEQARGDFVAMITQDAEPPDARWLRRLLDGFDISDDVALVYGPYIPRPDCPWRDAVRLTRFFASFGDGPRVDRLSPSERQLPSLELIGPRAYFTDANGCIRREAWRHVPYPNVPYAEDHALGLAMLKAGYAKVYMPSAGILHSHHYTLSQRLRRAFDDWRGLLEIYGWREPANPRRLLLQLRGAAGMAYRSMAGSRASPAAVIGAMLAAVEEEGFQLAGALLGSRADRLPRAARQVLSLDGRDTVCPFALWSLEAPGTTGSHSRRYASP